MTAHYIARPDLLAKISSAIAMSLPDSPDQWASWYAGFLRYICSAYCPSPRRKIIRGAIDLLESVISPQCLDEALVDKAVDGLFLANDIVELSSFMVQGEEYQGDWIFLAPPSFTLYPSKRVHIMGIAPDFGVFLPEDLLAQVKYLGPHRFIESSSSSEIVARLRAYGIREQIPDLAVAMPSYVPAETYVSRAINKLGTMNTCGAVNGLKVLGNRAHATRYRDRWVEPTDHSGYFVCRRPSAFGAEQWIFAQLQSGRAIRFIDLPWAEDDARGCDAAWRLQLALDAKVNEHAVYWLASDGENLNIKFSFPLPLWAQRRLQLLTSGRCTAMEVNGIPSDVWSAERAMLEKLLWLREKQ